MVDAPHQSWILTKKKKILEGCSLIDYTLGLFPRSHQFESHKPCGYCRLTWSLTLRPVGLVEVHASWLGHPR